MADLVERVLQEAAEKESKYKTIEVHKDIELEIDAGNLLTVDTNPLDTSELKRTKEEFLKNLARDNTQLLLNTLWQLPTEKVDDAIVVKLPDPKTSIPREKPIPKDKHLTKWQQYAQLKGIQKRKKSRMTWDDQAKEWRPRWGYKRANDDTQEWCLEVPDNAEDPNVDLFAKRKEQKKERLAKNELQRLRNIARSQKSKVPGVGLTPTEAPTKDYLGKALAVARKSTASIGKFTDKLPTEKASKYTGKKRKFEPNYGDVEKESKKQLGILNHIQNRIPIVDSRKAANRQIMEEQRSRAKTRREEGGGKKGGKNKGGSGKKKGGGRAKTGKGGKRGGKKR
ncbi:ribosome biogenesis regulatory protein homolog [Ostrea edulis]|uniref:ribosome biogenesis regulatory protein homolog n=1 Tax=Ostrea edulis TaxID=37623 RepID=UPI0024AE9D9B|nr:ribosome biogenesis regulatory protein homolog [Ostrea edulis]